MTDATQQRIGQEIRLRRGILKAEADWARAQPESPAQIELFRYVAFWRLVLKDAELRLNFGDIGEVEAGTIRAIGR
jgi:hypothetical protein